MKVNFDKMFSSLTLVVSVIHVIVLNSCNVIFHHVLCYKWVGMIRTVLLRQIFWIFMTSKYDVIQ